MSTVATAAANPPSFRSILNRSVLRLGDDATSAEEEEAVRQLRGDVTGWDPERIARLRDAALEAGVRPERLDRALGARASDEPDSTGVAGVWPDSTGAPADPGEEPGTGVAGVAALPPGFEMKEDGLWYQPQPKDGEEEDPPKPVWVCSRLEVTAMTRTADGEEWGRLLEFKDPDGRHHRWACPMEALAGDGTQFRSALLSMGLGIAPSKRARDLLATYVQTANVEARAVCVDRTGWYNEVYVFPDCAVGESGERVLLQTLAEPPRLRQSGTGKEWRENVGALCSGNSRLVFAASTAFAAPLLDITRDESGGVHLVGPSSEGKTTALRVGASVSGGPEGVHRWRATANGLEAVARTHNDSLLVLDELGQVDPREAGEVAYMLANGSGKHRARRDGLSRRAAEWRLLFLSAGEVGLADHMREAGRRSKAGQEVRLADIPANAGKDHGVFEELHGYADGGAFAEALTRAAGAYFGAPMRTFLARLVEKDREKLRVSIEALRTDFLKKALAKDAGGADGQVRRVAQRFGLIAAGGELATAWELTGWEKGEAIRAALACFRAWLGRRGGPGTLEEKKALEQVLHFLEAHGEARFASTDPRDLRVTPNRAGFRRVEGDATEYLIFQEVFKREVCEGFDPTYVARLLRDRGLLRTDDASRLIVKRNKVRGEEGGRFYAVRLRGGGDEG